MQVINQQGLFTFALFMAVMGAVNSIHPEFIQWMFPGF